MSGRQRSHPAAVAAVLIAAVLVLVVIVLT